MKNKYVYQFGDDFFSSFKKAYKAMICQTHLVEPDKATVKRINRKEIEANPYAIVVASYWRGSILSVEYPGGYKILQHTVN